MKEGTKKKDTTEWIKGLSPKQFQETFIEWYIPAIKSKFYALEERIKKLERPGK